VSCFRIPGLGEAVLAVLDDILALVERIDQVGLCRGVAFGIFQGRESLGLFVETGNDACHVGWSE
jgi:hypothetical protein